MRFQVPQFIETETKLIGPFTLKQFLWIASGTSIMFFAFITLPLYLFVVVSLPVGVISGSLAFVKIENQPLFNYIVYALAYLLNPKKYFFKSKDNPQPEIFDGRPAQDSQEVVTDASQYQESRTRDNVEQAPAKEINLPQQSNSPYAEIQERPQYKPLDRAGNGYNERALEEIRKQ